MYMRPPDGYNELRRRRTTARYMALPHWDEKPMIRRFVRQVRKHFEVAGVSISLVDKNRTILKYETLLNTLELPRVASLDAHTILSEHHFFLADASKDWRTRNNPLVTGPPHIKFYLGVPLRDVNGDNVGALAIYDAFAKGDEYSVNGEVLGCFAAKFVETLNTPIEQVREPKDPANVELADLSMRLGRATSRGMLVFEKDGSGSPYSQNNNFRITKFLKEIAADANQQDTLLRKGIFHKLEDVQSLKQAAAMMCRCLAEEFHVDVVYVVEIRIAEKFTMPGELFPKGEHKLDADTFEHSGLLVRSSDETLDVQNRLIGSHGTSTKTFDATTHLEAFRSLFGIKIRNPNNNTLFNVGAVIPFYRYHPKIVRKNTIDSKKIDVYLRSGGYLLGLMDGVDRNKYDPDTILSVFGCVSLLNVIYLIK